MANDINKAINANEIKNGTIIAACNKLGNTQKINTYVDNSPTISDIQSKYDARFDDPTYYTA
jgi:hypothetical protein